MKGKSSTFTFFEWPGFKNERVFTKTTGHPRLFVQIHNGYTSGTHIVSAIPFGVLAHSGDPGADRGASQPCVEGSTRGVIAFLLPLALSGAAEALRWFCAPPNTERKWNTGGNIRALPAERSSRRDARLSSVKTLKKLHCHFEKQNKDDTLALQDETRRAQRGPA